MLIINGRKIAAEVFERLTQQRKPSKNISIILVGKDESSLRFIEQKKRFAKSLGIFVELIQFPTPVPEADFLKRFKAIASSPKVGGVVLQLPLPKKISRDKALALIPKEKDLDCIGEAARKDFLKGKHKVLPPAVGTVQEILKSLKVNPKTKTFGVVGKGFLVGSLVAAWLGKKAKKTLIFEKGSSFKTLKKADVVITGVGKGGLIKPEMLKQGAGVIDFGYDFPKGKLRGDFDDSKLVTDLKLKKKIKFYTPTPGGTGPIVVAKLFENFFILDK